ncbi:MAG: AMP-binding protein [Deltaproteobacteria bacterium]|nr:AMP-binding protein [Deltaproteobacteria bacterium]
MANWIDLGRMMGVNAKKWPGAVALADAGRSFTYAQTDERCCRLANALLGLGLEKGDKVAVLLENNIEICEAYIAAARAGLVLVPVNFRLVAPEVRYILEFGDVRAVITEDEFAPVIDEIRGQLPAIDDGRYVNVGGGREGYVEYETLLARGSSEPPQVDVRPQDTWIMLFTSGTTGKPKGVLRTHESYAAFYLINAVDFRFHRGEVCLNVMPLCHVNSTFFTLNVLYQGGKVYVHPARSFRPLEVFEIIEKEKITFISLVPTHYQVLLSVEAEERAKFDISSVDKLLCSSAPARCAIKLGIMELFPGVDLYEGYGSTEAGIVTTLMPDEQMDHLGAIGRESSGTDFVKILDENGDPVERGQVGELYSRSPMMFAEYYKMPEKTAESFRGEWFTARDMAREDEDGYFHIVDRKDNMIITGGEKVFPTEVEAVVASHQAVYDCAVIGLPHPKWGDQVTVVVVLKPGQDATAEEITSHCRDKVAGYKLPRRVVFIEDDDMPRTATGKILHRILRERYGD